MDVTGPRCFRRCRQGLGIGIGIERKRDGVDDGVVDGGEIVGGVLHEDDGVSGVDEVRRQPKPEVAIAAASSRVESVHGSGEEQNQSGEDQGGSGVKLAYRPSEILAY
ncbi:hypothetical protein RchiOBHm_Chr6g0282711 [Rosa chinensis]|uniref:Uncharacterized protein n=1 Tax=Rosa chinensis TaxID=74649 RepID=A0A2P6PTU0_ROSCH|nr:hypothetical protein RchiOBHm_Chr6g0282711 [Rosa chinensis]